MAGLNPAQLHFIDLDFCFLAGRKIPDSSAHPGELFLWGLPPAIALNTHHRNAMSYDPTLTLDSESLPGVKFTVQRIGFGRRTELDLATLKFRQRLRELEMDSPQPSPKELDLQEQLELAKKKALEVPEADMAEVIRKDVLPIAEDLANAAPLEVRKQRKVIDEEYLTVHSQIRAVWIRRSLVSISGGEVDGMTADQLLDYGPQSLAQEIWSALSQSGRLTSEQAKNSPSPTISAGPEKAKTSTDASSAGTSGSTGSATASASTPAS
jgi:hypothetical protein